MRPAERRLAGAGALAALFLAFGSYHIDRPGLQADELLFAQGVFDAGIVALETRVFGVRTPLMQMPYLGSLKSIVYRPIIAVFGPSAATVRIPALLVGAAVVALTFLLLWRMAGERAAWLGGGLLAVDPTFLFTTRCDWGPVAFEHLLKLGGITLFQKGRYAWGAFLFGLALWNKTTFIWTLFGLAAGVLIFYRPQLRLPVATMLLAAASFALGAYPWIRYNVHSQGGTAKATARFDATDLTDKAVQMGRALYGTSLYGYMTRVGDARPWPSANFTPWLLAMAALSAIFTRNRIALFFLTVLAASWLSMALTYGAGGSAHHNVLLWPWPQCVIATAVPHWRRISIAAVLGILASAGVVVHHYVLIDRYGSDTPWSEAGYAMAARVNAEQPSGVFLNDWGLYEQIMFFSLGRFPFQVTFDSTQPPGELAARPGWIFVGYTDPHQNFKNVNARWKSIPGFRRVPIATIRDRQNNPIYELFRFAPLQSPSAAGEVKPIAR